MAEWKEGVCFVCGKKLSVGIVCKECADKESQDEIREEERDREEVYEQEWKEDQEEL